MLGDLTNNTHFGGVPEASRSQIGYASVAASRAQACEFTRRLPKYQRICSTQALDLAARVVKIKAVTRRFVRSYISQPGDPMSCPIK